MYEFSVQYEGFVNRLESAMKITGLNHRILEIVDETLESIGRVNNEYGRDVVANKRASLSKISSNPEVKESLEIVYGQQIVLFVSAFETYLKDLVRGLCEEHPDLFRWSESNYKIELSELSDPATTKGDILLAAIIKQGTNFQDLQSIVRFFSKYLDINLTDIDDMHKNQFILATSMRHIIVHANGVVNKEFIKNIRDLPNLKGLYKIDFQLDILEDDVIASRDALLLISTEIESRVSNRIREGAIL